MTLKHVVDAKPGVLRQSLNARNVARLMPWVKNTVPLGSELKLTPVFNGESALGMEFIILKKPVLSVSDIKTRISTN